MSPVSASAARRACCSLTGGHVVAGRDLPGGVEGVGLDAEHDLGLVALGKLGQIPQQAGGPADAEHQHAGGVGIEGAAVADLAGAQHPPGPGHHVVAGPPGGLVDNRNAVRRHAVLAARRPVATPSGGIRTAGPASVSGQPCPDVQQAFDPRRRAQSGVGAEHQLGGATQPGLVAHGAPQPAGVLLEGLDDVGVVLLGVVQRREPHHRPVQVPVHVGAGHRHHGQPVVVELLQRLGHYPPDQFADPGGAVAGPMIGMGAAVPPCHQSSPDRRPGLTRRGSGPPRALRRSR